MINEEHIDELNLLKLSIANIAERVKEENETLNELTKEYLGEAISEDILLKIINDEINKEVMKKLEAIFFGKWICLSCRFIRI